ncbi:mycothiol synthase [soil metagenome]
MSTLEIKRRLCADDLSAVADLLRLAEQVDGHQVLGAHDWVDLATGGRHDFAGLVAWEPGHEHPVGYAQVTRNQHNWAVELVIDPHHRYEALTIGPELLGSALDVVGAEGGGHVHWLVYEPTSVHEQIAVGAGLRRGRDLWQMRRSLPVPPPVGGTAVGEVAALPTRPFVPGRDEAAWLEVNNRAFERHPEQGDWTAATLKEREAEPWFDPDGFLLHEGNEPTGPPGRRRLAGFCWTKVHDDHDPPLGEIYVVAVDPDFAGRGLGRALVLAGLDHLHRRGLSTAMLYVDASNTRAVRLYENLGFELNHVDRAFVGDVVPSADRPPPQAGAANSPERSERQRASEGEN